MQHINFAFNPGAAAIDTDHARRDAGNNLIVNGLGGLSPLLHRRVGAGTEQDRPRTQVAKFRVGKPRLTKVYHQLVHGDAANHTVGFRLGVPRVNTHRGVRGNARHTVGVAERDERKGGGLIGGVPQPVRDALPGGYLLDGTHIPGEGHDGAQPQLLSAHPSQR